MLKVSVDEAHAFDMLAILEVKNLLLDSKDGKLKAYQAFQKLSIEISDQLGFNNVRQILASTEYRNLVETNSETFLLVDEARSAKSGLAKKTDAANMERYKAKVALQKKFFQRDLTETKSKQPHHHE